MLWDTVISLIAVAIVVLVFWKMPDDDEAWDEPAEAEAKPAEPAAEAKPEPAAGDAPAQPEAPKPDAAT